MPAPKSNWIAKSQQMMYPIEMQAIGMSNQANAQIAQSIERTGQRVQEIQLKKQAFAEHHQRTMMMQAAEQQKMALQNIKLGQDREKMLLLEQKHALDQKTGKQKNYQSQLGRATYTEDGKIRLNLAGEGGKMTFEEFTPNQFGQLSKQDKAKYDFLRQSQMRPQSPSSMDQNTQVLREGNVARQRDRRVDLNIERANLARETTEDQIEKARKDIGDNFTPLSKSQGEVPRVLNEIENLNLEDKKAVDNFLEINKVTLDAPQRNKEALRRIQEQIAEGNRLAKELETIRANYRRLLDEPATEPATEVGPRGR